MKMVGPHVAKFDQGNVARSESEAENVEGVLSQLDNKSTELGQHEFFRCERCTKEEPKASQLLNVLDFRDY